MKATIPNPAGRNLRPVEIITDRAKRYRANAAIEQEERRCIYCGTTRGRLDVEHINGREADNEPENLAWACRPCNTRKGAYYAKMGAGKRTRQYNPAKKRQGIQSLAMFVKAVNAVQGLGDGQLSLFEGEELLRATPKNQRSEYAREANRIRWSAARRPEPVPF